MQENEEKKLQKKMKLFNYQHYKVRIIRKMRRWFTHMPTHIYRLFTPTHEPWRWWKLICTVIYFKKGSKWWWKKI